MSGAVRVAFALAVSGIATAAVGQAFDPRARALDGDTVAVDLRLPGVDAFERGQLCERVGGCWQCGKAAQDVAANGLRAKTASIRLTPSTTYGRPVAVVTVDGDDLGERCYDASPADTRRYAHAVGLADPLFDCRYPLREWNWTRDRCAARIEAAGLPVPPKSSCFFCGAIKPD